MKLLCKKLTDSEKHQFAPFLILKYRAIHIALQWKIYAFTVIPSWIHDVFRRIASQSPVCSYVSCCSSLYIFRQICEEGFKSDPSELAAMQKDFPIFFHALKAVSIETSLLPGKD